MGDKIKLNLITKQLKNKKGFALLGTLILVFVVSTLGIALLTMTRNEIKSSALQKASKETFYIAESGIDHAISFLEKHGTPDFPNPHYLVHRIFQIPTIYLKKMTIILIWEMVNIKLPFNPILHLVILLDPEEKDHGAIPVAKLVKQSNVR